MDLFGTLMWIALLIHPFLAYQTGKKWMGRLTLGFLLGLMGLFLYRHSGFDAYESLQSVWDVLLTVYLVMLVMNSYLVSRRLVPELPASHIGFIVLSSFILSQTWWSVMSSKTWNIAQLVDVQTLLMTLIIALVLLLIVCLKMIDRRVQT